MNFGFGRGARMQPETDPISRIMSKQHEQRTWRMKQALISNDHAKMFLEKAALRDNESKLQALAHVLLMRFHGVGYAMFPPELPSKLIQLVGKLRADPENFTRISKGNGREIVGSKMRPGPYLLVIAAEAMMFWLNVKTLENAGNVQGLRHARISQAELDQAHRQLDERVQGCLSKLSGNMASTVRDDQGRMNQAATVATVTMMPVGDGLSVPADMIIAAQLQEYGIHPKQMAFVMWELLFDAAKGPALMQMDRAFAKVMCQAADAMVLLAADPAYLPQHPSLDLAAAANAAVQAAANRAGVGSGSTASSRAAAAAASSSSAGASSSRQAIGHANMLPPPGSMEDAMTLQMIRGTPVSALRAWLEAETVSYRHCVEKEDMVQLVLQTYKSDAYKTKQQASAAASTDERPDPHDMTKWLHMALFLKAEAGEATQGRPPAVVTAFKAAAALALKNDDEIYGCLCAWNAVKAIKDGGKPYSIGDLLRWLDAAYTCKQQMSHWHAYMMVEPRINVIKSMKSDIKKSADEFRGRGRSRRSTFTYEDIRNTQVRSLVQPGDEHIEILPCPSMARGVEPVTTAPDSAGKPCANCNQLFHARMVCGRCKSIWYCGKDCQTQHWKQHKQECERLKAEKAASQRR